MESCSKMMKLQVNAQKKTIMCANNMTVKSFILGLDKKILEYKTI